jgi:phage-related protein
VASPTPRPLCTLFFQTEAGNEPVRDWLKALPRADQKLIGADILAVQWKWPVGKPLVDSLGGGLWEVRSSLGDRIARVFFIVVDEEIILLHGIIKKSRTAPKNELDLARSRQAVYMKHTTRNEKESTAKRPPRK